MGSVQEDPRKRVRALAAAACRGRLGAAGSAQTAASGPAPKRPYISAAIEHHSCQAALAF